METEKVKTLMDSFNSLKKDTGYIREAVRNSGDIQKAVLADILSYASDTEFGKKYDFSSIRNADEYRERIPLSEFADYSEYIERLKKAWKELNAE